MGNVMAATSSTPSSAATALDKAAKQGLPEPAPPGALTSQSKEKDDSLENPGTVEELHKKCKG